MLFIRKLHKWLGLLVGLQLVLWTLSGLVFSWLDQDAVSADRSIRPAAAGPLLWTVPLSEPSAWLKEGQGVYEVRLMALLDHGVWRVASEDGVELRHAHDGAPFVLERSHIERLALERYAGSGRLQAMTYHAGGSLESRGAGAVWRAQFDDAQRTALYFSAGDGALVAARNSTWRWFDFFWMLHTMDYRGRDDFNHPLVITATTATLWLVISGFVLLFRSFRPGDFGLRRR